MTAADDDRQARRSATRPPPSTAATPTPTTASTPYRTTVTDDDGGSDTRPSPSRRQHRPASRWLPTRRPRAPVTSASSTCTDAGVDNPSTPRRRRSATRSTGATARPSTDRRHVGRRAPTPPPSTAATPTHDDGTFTVTVTVTDDEAASIDDRPSPSPSPTRPRRRAGVDQTASEGCRCLTTSASITDAGVANRPHGEPFALDQLGRRRKPDADQPRSLARRPTLLRRQRTPTPTTGLHGHRHGDRRRSGVDAETFIVTDGNATPPPTPVSQDGKRGTGCSPRLR